MRTILSSSRRLSGFEVSLPEFRIYWPHAARVAKRDFPPIERVLSVRYGMKGNGELLGLVVQTSSSCFALSTNGARQSRCRSVGTACDQLLAWKGLRRAP